VALNTINLTSNPLYFGSVYLSTSEHHVFVSVPGEVASLSFNDIFDTSVKVMWQPPTEINGILTGMYISPEWDSNSQC
jgi:hypothetical protein